MMIEYVLDPQQFERQGDQENIVGRITGLNDMKAAPQKDPPSVEKLPKERPAVFPEMTQGSASFFRHRVPVDPNHIDNFVRLLVPFPSGTQYGHFIPIMVQRGGLLPNTRIERNGCVFHDDEDLLLHGNGPPACNSL